MLDKWREPHGSMAGRMAIKSDLVEEVENALKKIGEFLDLDETEYKCQSLDRITIGDLERLGVFLDGVALTLRLLKAETEGRAVRAADRSGPADYIPIGGAGNGA